MSEVPGIKGRAKTSRMHPDFTTDLEGSKGSPG